jgi:hypothetical protein
MRSLPALVFTLVASTASAQERLLPSLDYATKTPEQWMQAFESAEKKSAEPLWCLYWCGVRSEAVIKFLEKQRHESPDPRPGQGTFRSRGLGREIDEILVQWNVAHEPLPPQWNRARAGMVLEEADPRTAVFFMTDPETPAPEDPRWYRVPSGLFALPTALLDEPDARLVQRLESTDRFEQAQAAVTLISRRHELAKSMRALVVRVAGDRAHAPMAAGEGVAYVSDGNGAMVGHSRSPWYTRAPLATQEFPLEHLSAYALEWATGVLGTAGARAVAEIMTAGTDDVEALKRVCLDAGRTRTHWTPEALAILDAAQESAHLGMVSWGSWANVSGNPGSTDSPWSEPSSKERSSNDVTPWSATPDAPDTRANRVREIGRVMSTRAENPEAYDDLRRLLAELRAPYGEHGADGPNDAYQAGLWILDDLRIATPDVADWCIAIMLDDEHFDVHMELASHVLRRCNLSLRQEALLVQMSDSWLPHPQSAFFVRLGAAAIERAARLRTYAQGWTDMNVLRDLLQISAPSSQDIEMLVAAIERGFVIDRSIALAILDEHAEISTPDLHTAVLMATDDCDDTVRAAARALKAKRMW